MNVFKARFSYVMVSFIAALFCLSVSSLAAASSKDEKIKAMSIAQIIEKAKQNRNWKTAVFTGKYAQVVFMSVSPSTNPKNEIGMETHDFDQVIFVAAGSADVILNGVKSKVKAGDLLAIPQGVAHNLVNTDPKQPLKIISVYSSTDIPAKSIIKKKADASD